jgi:predicted dehydrogenase
MLNVAVVGLGWWGKTIVRTLKESGAMRVVRVVDVDPAADEAARQLGVEFGTDFDAALGDSRVEALVLCTPHTQHGKQIVKVAAAGKHVFCEKPLCLTLAEAARAVAACREAGVVLGIGHERRFEPPILELRRLVQSGALGTLLQIEANFSQDKFLSLPAGNWRLSGSEAPAGPMTATGIHLLDLSVSFLGPAERVVADVKQLGSPLTNGDTLAALVTFKSGAHALITAILATPFDGRFAIYGNEGWAEVRDLAHPESPAGWTLTTCLRGGERETRPFPPAQAVRSNLEAFAAAATGGAPYPVPHDEMLANIAAMEAIFRSASSGRIEPVGASETGVGEAR